MIFIWFQSPCIKGVGIFQNFDANGNILVGWYKKGSFHLGLGNWVYISFNWCTCRDILAQNIYIGTGFRVPTEKSQSKSGSWSFLHSCFPKWAFLTLSPHWLQGIVPAVRVLPSLRWNFMWFDITVFVRNTRSHREHLNWPFTLVHMFLTRTRASASCLSDSFTSRSLLTPSWFNMAGMCSE